MSTVPWLWFATNIQKCCLWPESVQAHQSQWVLSAIRLLSPWTDRAAWSVNRNAPTAVPILFTHLERIQSIATQKRAGAWIQPWRTPNVDSNGCESWPAIRTRDVVPRWRPCIRLKRKGGAPMQRSAFHNAQRSTESKAAFMSINATFNGWLTLKPATEGVFYPPAPILSKFANLQNR